MTLVGDGVVGAVYPRRHAARWLTGPAAWRRMVRPFVDNPGLTRAAAAVELVVGMWWVGRLPPRSR